jgi:hypothetical protein
MAKKYKSRSKRHSRSKRGGRSALLGYDNYSNKGGSAGSWTSAAPPGSLAAQAAGFKTPMTRFSGGTPAENAANANRFALTGQGQGQSGGGRSKRRGKKIMKTSKKISPKSFGYGNASEQQMAQGMTQAQGQAQAAAMQQAQAQQQTGGMFASFGALLKEALVDRKSVV